MLLRVENHPFPAAITTGGNNAHQKRIFKLQNLDMLSFGFSAKMHFKSLAAAGTP